MAVERWYELQPDGVRVKIVEELDGWSYMNAKDRGEEVRFEEIIGPGHSNYTHAFERAKENER